MDLSKVSPLTQGLTGKSLPTAGDEGGNFSDVLKNYLRQVNNSLNEAEKMTQDFALGKNIELHQVVLATEQASLALQLTIQIRNKIIEAYQEVMRMQL